MFELSIDGQFICAVKSKDLFRISKNLTEWYKRPVTMKIREAKILEFPGK